MDAMNEMGGFTDRSKKFGLNIISFVIFLVMTGGISLVVMNIPLPAQMRTYLSGAGMIVAAVLALAPRVANQWESAVVLMLGKFV